MRDHCVTCQPPGMIVERAQRPSVPCTTENSVRRAVVEHAPSVCSHRVTAGSVSSYSIPAPSMAPSLYCLTSRSDPPGLEEYFTKPCYSGTARRSSSLGYHPVTSGSANSTMDSTTTPVNPAVNYTTQQQPLVDRVPAPLQDRIKECAEASANNSFLGSNGFWQSPLSLNSMAPVVIDSPPSALVVDHPTSDCILGASSLQEQGSVDSADSTVWTTVLARLLSEEQIFDTAVSPGVAEVSKPHCNSILSLQKSQTNQEETTTVVSDSSTTPSALYSWEPSHSPDAHASLPWFGCWKSSCSEQEVMAPSSSSSRDVSSRHSEQKPVGAADPLGDDVWKTDILNIPPKEGEAFLEASPKPWTVPAASLDHLSPQPGAYVPAEEEHISTLCCLGQVSNELLVSMEYNCRIMKQKCSSQLIQDAATVNPNKPPCEVESYTTLNKAGLWNAAKEWAVVPRSAPLSGGPMDASLVMRMTPAQVASFRKLAHLTDAVSFGGVPPDRTPSLERDGQDSAENGIRSATGYPMQLTPSSGLDVRLTSELAASLQSFCISPQPPPPLSHRRHAQSLRNSTTPMSHLHNVSVSCMKATTAEQQLLERSSSTEKSSSCHKGARKKKRRERASGCLFPGSSSMAVFVESPIRTSRPGEKSFVSRLDAFLLPPLMPPETLAPLHILLPITIPFGGILISEQSSMSEGKTMCIDPSKKEVLGVHSSCTTPQFSTPSSGLSRETASHHYYFPEQYSSANSMFSRLHGFCNQSPAWLALDIGYIASREHQITRVVDYFLEFFTRRFSLPRTEERSNTSSSTPPDERSSSENAASFEPITIRLRCSGLRLRTDRGSGWYLYEVPVEPCEPAYENPLNRVIHDVEEFTRHLSQSRLCQHAVMKPFINNQLAIVVLKQQGTGISAKMIERMERVTCDGIELSEIRIVRHRLRDKFGHAMFERDPRYPGHPIFGCPIACDQHGRHARVVFSRVQYPPVITCSTPIQITKRNKQPSPLGL